MIVERDHCLITHKRTARRRRVCDSCGDYRETIKPGDVYLEHTAFPGHDSGMAGYRHGGGRPVRAAECSDCATRYGRAALLTATEPLPA